MVEVFSLLHLQAYIVLVQRSGASLNILQVPLLVGHSNFAEIQVRMPTTSTQVELAVSARRLWAAIKDGNKLFPKIAPEFISSIQTIEGNPGEVGEVTLIKLGSKHPGAEEESYVKEKLLRVDDETMTAQMTEVEGGHITVGFTKWQPEIKIVPIGTDRVRVISTVEYEGDLDATIAIALHMEGMPMLCRRMEKYLQETDT